MGYIRENAQNAVQALLKRTHATLGPVLSATDVMDDGSRIVLQVTIDGDAGTAVFDFTGTGPEVYGLPQLLC